MGHITRFKQLSLVANEGIQKIGDIFTVRYNPNSSPSTVVVDHSGTRSYHAGTAKVLSATKPHKDDQGRLIQWLELETEWDNP